MKTFLSAIISLMTIVTVYSQCDAPIVESWSVSETVNYSVNFTPPEGALTYELIISADYGNLIPSEPLIHTGNISSGINTINFDVTGLLENTTYYARYYFTAQLSVTCANGSESGINRFYVSALSLLNDPAINVGDFFFKPLTFLPDGSGFSYDSYLSIPAAEVPVEIEDISVFIDLGHTFNGDLSIELISPQGISIYLLSISNGLAGYKGFSVIFQDGMPTIGIDGTGSTRGLYSPFQPLSAFTGINPEGVWIVRVTDHYAIDNGMLFGVSLIINSSPCESSIHGKAYYDLNSNAIQDENEPGFGNALISNSSGSETIFASSTGQFTKCLQAGSGVLSISNPPPYYSYEDIPYSINTGDVLDSLDFALIPQSGIKDLKIELFASTPNRPGFSSDYLVHYQNIGTECVDNVAIDIDLDALLLITASGNPNVSFSGNIASLNIPQICPLESGMFSITAYLNDTVSLGTLLESTAQISPTEGDENSSDNVSTYATTVVGSFDPNDKWVSHSTIHPGFDSGNQPLKYMVRFQNTGTYYAERVLIIDTLDFNLDLNSFSIVSASHDVNVTRNGNVYYFEFDQIFLPDSTTNEPESHGFIRYEIKPMPGLAVGESIENTAYIFFDFNEPIVTNTVSTVMEFPSGVSEITYQARVYPNPASSEINLEWAPDLPINYVRIIDLTGREVASYSAAGQRQMTIPIDNLHSGIYLFQFNSRVSVKPVVWIKN